MTESDLRPDMAQTRNRNTSLPGLSSMYGVIPTDLVDITGLKIACIGAGYVGGPTMSIFSSVCPEITVTLVDINQEKIDQWNSDNIPIYEPGLDEIVKKQRGINLFFSTDIDGVIAEADIIFVSVNTPTKTKGVGAGRAADLKYIEAAARRICKVCKGNKIVVEKSTVPCKTAESMRRILATGDYQFDILSNPEFLSEGTAIKDLMNPDRMLIGGMPTPSGYLAIRTLASIYAKWVPINKIITTNLWSSELSKLAANALLAQRISSINALSAICEKTGADISEVAYACGLDHRIGSKFLKASLGFGGSCFTKDILNLCYLSESLNLPEVADYWGGVLKMNDHQTDRFVKQIVTTMFSTVTDKVLAIWGFAFKKNTGDTRASPAIKVCRDLLVEGAKLQIYDPKVSKKQMELDLASGDTKEECNLQFNLVYKNVKICGDKMEAVEEAHALIILTEWDEFIVADFKQVKELMATPPFVFDGRLILPHGMLKELEFEVKCIGKAL